MCLSHLNKSKYPIFYTFRTFIHFYSTPKMNGEDIAPLGGRRESLGQQRTEDGVTLITIFHGDTCTRRDPFHFILRRFRAERWMMVIYTWAYPGSVSGGQGESIYLYRDSGTKVQKQTNKGLALNWMTLIETLSTYLPLLIATPHTLTRTQQECK